MSIEKTTCRIHKNGKGGSSLYIDHEMTGKINLPFNEKLIFEYDDVENKITIMEM